MKTLKYFLLLSLFIIAQNSLFAQSTFEYTFSVYSGSDYYSYIDFNHKTIACDCTDEYNFSGWARPPGSFVPVLIKSSKSRSGTLTFPVGPSRTYEYAMTAKQIGSNNLVFSCVTSCEPSGSVTRSKSTLGIRSVRSTTATTDRDYIEVSWVTASDIPAANHYYEIARDDPANVIATRSGKVKNTRMTFTDRSVGPDEEHTYYIRTKTDDWGGHTSSDRSQVGRTRPRQLLASVGQPRQVGLSWDDLSEATSEVVIRRDGAQIIELSINSDADTAYLDSDPALIPGKIYEYTLSWSRGDEEYSLLAAGATQPNGRISGSVKTPLTQLPIAGVRVCVELENDLDQLPAGTMYCDTTDEFGDYSIRQIYYGTEATFTITPFKENHAFDPAVVTEERLDLEVPAVNVSFADTTAFVVSGMVAQTMNGDTCGLEGVEIWIDGLFKGDRTGAGGFYSLGVEESGNYELSARLGTHGIEPGSQTVIVNADVVGINFIDTATNIIEGVVKAGCDIFIGHADVRLYSGGDSICMDTTLRTDTLGRYYAVLPARPYEMEVVSFEPDSEVAIDPDEVLSYFPTTPVDLTNEPHQEDFIFRRPPSIELVGIPDKSCSTLEGPVVEQGEEYILKIAVSESFGSESCLVETGFLIVIDEVGDRDGMPDTIMLEDGKAEYKLKPGRPNLIGPHLKTLEISAIVGEEVSQWSERLIVTGIRAREQTFATVMPEIPFMILHDPPGDASYSFREANQISTIALRTFAASEGSLTASTEVKLGSKFDITQDLGPVETTQTFENWGTIGKSLSVGASIEGQTEWVMQQTSMEKFSTSGNQDITGEEGDLYIGAAMNIIYALADVLSIDPTSCEISLGQDMIMGNNGFATTFMYTEDHVKNSLIPQLQQLRDLYADQESDSSAIYQSQMGMWQQVLDNNRRNKQRARLVENISFSAGAGYLSSNTLSNTGSVSLSGSLFLEESVAIGAGFNVAGSGIQGKVEAKVRFEIGGSVGASLMNSVTTGYELNDDDQGDFFSVNIREDPVYGTPVFETVSGRSSCPKEDETQPRESLQLLSESFSQFDIAEDEAAVFQLELGNVSQSDEPRTYLFQFLQESNPEGAVVTIGGSQAQGIIPYTIPAGGKRNVTVTISRGARAFNYQGLKFALKSGCEDDLIGDTVSLSVKFKSDFPAIGLIKPNPTWSLSQADQDMMLVRYAGFDLNQIKKVQLQYAPQGSFAWEVGEEWLPNALEGLGGDFTAVWSTADLRDGAYDIRLRADYGTGDVFSDIHTGNIDRIGPTLFGLPEPADQELVLGDVISFSFDQPINCRDLSAANVKFFNTETNEEYPVQLGCSGNRLIVSPLWNLSNHLEEEIQVELEGVTDLFGNPTLDTLLRWSFRVGDGGLDDVDVDQDGIENQLDNCALAANPNQEDLDGDGLGDLCDDDDDGDGILDVEDNCGQTANGPQLDLDLDGIGDACDSDRDGDGIPNEVDNCPDSSNVNQTDLDGNGIGDVCEEVTTSTFDALDGAVLSASPNPAFKYVNVRLEGEAIQLHGWNLVTINGTQIDQSELNTLCRESCGFQLDVSGYPSGLYFMQLHTNHGTGAIKLSILK